MLSLMWAWTQCPRFVYTPQPTPAPPSDASLTHALCMQQWFRLICPERLAIDVAKFEALQQQSSGYKDMGCCYLTRSAFHLGSPYLPLGLFVCVVAPQALKITTPIWHTGWPRWAKLGTNHSQH